MAKISQQNQKNNGTTTISTDTNISNNNVKSNGTVGQEDMKLIYGTRIVGMNHRTRKEDKSILACKNEEKVLHNIEVLQDIITMGGGKLEEEFSATNTSTLGLMLPKKKLQQHMTWPLSSTKDLMQSQTSTLAGIKWLKPNNNNLNLINQTQSNQIFSTSGTSAQLESSNFEQTLTFLNDHQPNLSNVENIATQPRPSNASSALGLLLQSSKFREMMEMTNAADYTQTPQGSDPPKCSFPEDIQTYFEC